MKCLITIEIALVLEYFLYVKFTNNDYSYEVYETRDLSSLTVLTSSSRTKIVILLHVGVAGQSYK